MYLSEGLRSHIIYSRRKRLKIYKLSTFIELFEKILGDTYV